MNDRNLSWQQGTVTRSQRQQLLGQQGVTLWFTGLSGSGKSTIAVALEQALLERGKLSYRLDGDNIRLGINSNLGFSEADRTENIRRVGEVSKLFADSGIITLCSFISPYRADRRLARKTHEKDGIPFIEVHVNCPLECAEARDPKGLYRRARAGEIANFTGIDAPYEKPEAAEMVLDTDRLGLDEEVAMLIAELQGRNLLIEA